MKKLLALLSLFVLLFTSSAGCIDIYLFNEWLVPQEDEEIEYEDVEMVVANYTFKSSFNPITLNFDEILNSHRENGTVPIVEGTAGLRFNIHVQMRSAEDIWEDLNDTLNGSIDNPFYDQIAAAIEAAILYLSQRYVDITISKPDGTVWYDNRTGVSMEAEVRLAKADPGDWSVVVQGDGIGFDFSDWLEDLKLEDSFMVTAVIRQPK
jgi:hypothetical protein